MKDRVRPWPYAFPVLAAGGSVLFLPGAVPSPPASSAPALAPFVEIVLGGSPQRIEAGDFDGDGDADLVVLSSSLVAAGSSVLENSGGGSFAVSWSAVLDAPLLDSPPDLEVGDLDGDGDLDLLVSVPFGGVAGISSRLNAGDGTFDAVVPLPAGGQRVDQELGDLDGDGVLDFGYHEIEVIGYVGTRKGNGDGSFQLTGPEIPGGSVDANLRAALGEVTGDALEDMLTASFGGLLLLHGHSAGGFPGWGSGEVLASGPFGDVALADLDGDGRNDAVATRPGAGTVTVLLGQPGGGLGSPTDFPAGPQPDAIVVADVDLDSVPDVVITHLRRGLVSVLAGAGDGSLLAPVAFVVTRFPTDVAAADLDLDGDVDLAVTDGKAGTVTLLLNPLL